MRRIDKEEEEEGEEEEEESSLAAHAERPPRMETLDGPTAIGHADNWQLQFGLPWKSEGENRKKLH